MGLSASQARLLTLTARLSDLELQSQQISNSKIRLAMESSQISEDYANALDKKELSILKGYDKNGDKEYEDLNYYNLVGPNSPLLAQYCLTNNNGNVLVTQEEASDFEQSGGDLDAFLVNCGAVKHTTTYPNDMTRSQYLKALQDAQVAINSTFGTYQTAISNTATALNALNSYGSTHVKGYAGAGQWSYSTTTSNTYSTGYSDNDVFSYLASTGATFVDQWDIQDSGWASQAYIRYPSSSSGAAPLCFYHQGDGDATTNLTNVISNVSSQTTAAVLSALKSQYKSGSDYANVLSKLQQAAASASAQTLSLYRSRIQSTQNYGGNDDANWLTKQYVSGSNQVWNDTHGEVELYIDLGQAVKTFLAYFDAACAQLNGNSSASYSNQVGSSSTNRSGSGIGITENTTTSASYNSTSTPNQIQYITGSGESADSVASTYQNLLNTYLGAVSTQTNAKTAWETAKAILAGLQGGVTTTTLTTSDKGYYTNLFNKMVDSGYIYMENEEDTLNSPAWIQSQITSGNLLLEKCAKDTDTNETSWSKVIWSSCSDIEEDSDDNYTAKQEAIYQAEMSKIQAKDKKFDLQLKNIDTEHNALQTEVESVQKVIDKNIERSFKIFQNA